MLRDAHELHMGVAHFYHIVGQLVGRLLICIIAILFRPAGLSPGAQMDLINGHGSFFRLCVLPLLHPFLIAPGKAGDIGGDGGGSWPELGAERIGIRFKKDLVILCGDGKFIKLASSKAWYEGFVDAGILQGLHGRRLRIPSIEVPNDAHRLRMGRPDGKVHTRLSAIGAGMGPQLFKDLIVGTLTEQVAVQFCNEAGTGRSSGLFCCGFTAFS